MKFDTVGAGTCVVIDYKDGYMAAYGDPNFCNLWSRSSTLPYVEGHEVIENPFLIDQMRFGLKNGFWAFKVPSFDCSDSKSLRKYQKML